MRSKIGIMADPPQDADNDRQLVSWRTMLKDEFEYTEDDFSRMQTTLTDEELDERFCPGYGMRNVTSFTAWGDRYVYLPVVEECTACVIFAPRNPCNEASGHVGG